MMLRLDLFLFADLVPLTVEQDYTTYNASYPIKDTTKSFLFVYKLKNAVKTYETYSDLTVPFFGTGYNHDKDIHNVTIDFVFPEAIEPKDYRAYFHSREGNVVEKGEELVRYYTPVSKMYNLTEIRLLFPSSIMTNQEKRKAPYPVEDVILTETNQLEQRSSKLVHLQIYEKGLRLVLILLGFTLFMLTFWRVLGKIKRSKSSTDLLSMDPLLLYVIQKRGRLTNRALLAGLFSLVENGKASVILQAVTNRFFRDPKSPNETLHFTLLAKKKDLTPTEQRLVSWTFKHRKTPSSSFNLTELAGATHKEKEGRKNMKRYFSFIHFYYFCFFV